MSTNQDSQDLIKRVTEAALKAISARDEFLVSCGFDYSLPGQKRALFVQTRSN